MNPQLDGEDELVCYCNGVTRKTLQAAIRAGCDSADALAMRTGAGLMCGCCYPDLEIMVGTPIEFVPVTCSTIQTVSPGIKSLRLEPLQGRLWPFLPGQHILVQAQLGASPSQRAYTISSTATVTDFYEITVKKGQGLSQWLHDKLTPGGRLKISKPRGNFCLRPHENHPVVFFAGGIGITPALSMLRSLQQNFNRQHLYIDYSAPSAADFIYATELRQASQHPQIQVNLRPTRDQGRIRLAAVQELVAQYRQAHFFICGRPDFVATLRQHLAECQVTTRQIHSEDFRPPASTGSCPAVLAESGSSSSPPSPVYCATSSANTSFRSRILSSPWTVMLSLLLLGLLLGVVWYWWH